MRAHWLAGLFALVSLFPATAAFAVNPCVLASGGIGGTGAPAAAASDDDGPGGIGGTGRATGAEGDGIGGTGVTADSDSGGIGGTGKTADEGGIGGTGIVGVITGFGSICVGGIEIHYGPATPISSDGGRLEATQLKIGHVVQVRARGLGDSVRAQSIELVHAVTGPVRAVDARTGRLEVLGQTVRASAALVAAAQAAARAGHPVLVSGLRNRAGEIVATRMDAAPGLKEFGVLGTVREVTQGGARIGNLSIKLDKAQARAIRQGQSLEICGALENGALRARTIETKGLDVFKGRVERVVIEGFVKQRHADRILIDDALLGIDANTRIIDGGELKADQRVVVAARMVNGKPVAERVERVRARDPERSGGARGGETSGEDAADSSQEGGGHGQRESEGRDEGDGKDADKTDSSHGGAGDSGSHGGRNEDSRDGGDAGGADGERSGFDADGAVDPGGGNVRGGSDSRSATENRTESDARIRADKDAERALRDSSRDRPRDAARPPKEPKPERPSGSSSHGGRPDRVRNR